VILTIPFILNKWPAVVHVASCPKFEYLHCCVHPGVEEPEAEAWWELSEDHVLSGSPLPDVHETEDAEHRPGHGWKSKWPAPRPFQVPQWDERPAGLPDVQIRHVLPKELEIKTISLPPLLIKSLLHVIWDAVWPKHVQKSCSFESQRQL